VNLLPYAPLRRLAARWRRDTRGTSMVTTAITLPVLIMLLFGLWYTFWWLTVKQSLHLGVTDAARYATEYGRYWRIDPTERSGVEGDILPADFYDQEARRIVASRLRDISAWTTETLNAGLVVRVDEPVLAYNPNKPDEAPIEEGFTEALCDPDESEAPAYRLPENIRLRVYAELNLPFFPVRIPYMPPITVTLSDRAIGYVQCPRWRGQREAGENDQSRKIGSEAPFFPFRNPLPTLPYPTVTTEPPTGTPPPSGTTSPP
jgi:hypothetical protein